MSNRDACLLTIFGTLLCVSITDSLPASPEPLVEAEATAPGNAEMVSRQTEQVATGPCREPQFPELIVHFNTALPEEFMLLPNVGERLADQLLQFREANFPVRSLEQLLLVPGIGPSRLREMAPFLQFSSAADSATQELADRLP